MNTEFSNYKRVEKAEDGTDIIIDVDTKPKELTEYERKETLVYKRKVKPYLQDIVKWRTEGKGYATISKLLDIAESTLYKYKTNVKELAEVWELGTALLSDTLEQSLYKEAIGYVYEEDALTKQGDIVSLKKLARPSISATKFALTNLRPKTWKNKVNAETSTLLSGVKLDAIKGLTLQELKNIVNGEPLELEEKNAEK